MKKETMKTRGIRFSEPAWTLAKAEAKKLWNGGTPSDFFRFLQDEYFKRKK